MSYKGVFELNNINLIDNYISNNELDLKRVIKDFEPYVKAIINKIASDNLSYEDKEEVLEDTFFVLWKNRSKKIISLDSYIAGITRTLVKEKLRKKKITYDIADYEKVIEFSNIDLFSEQREKIDRIEKKYKNLKSMEIEIINMFYYDDKSIKDIAKELNISEINVKTKLYRIRKKIKKELIKGE